MATRLELVRKLRQLAGVSAGPSGNGPVSTLNQTGEYKRLVDWLDEAWKILQLEFLWDFLWQEATITISSGNYVFDGARYPAHRYVKDSGRIGSTQLYYLPWHRFRIECPVALIAEGEPNTWTVRPDSALVFNHQVTANTSFVVERYGGPYVMAADTDTPLSQLGGTSDQSAMFDVHSDILVYKALLLYANFEEAGITRATAQAEYDKHLAALMRFQTPAWEFGDALC